jgi:hypothetical protein
MLIKPKISLKVGISEQNKEQNQTNESKPNKSNGVNNETTSTQQQPEINKQIPHEVKNLRQPEAINNAQEQNDQSLRNKSKFHN